MSLMLRKTVILCGGGNFSDVDNQCRLDPAFSKSGCHHNGRRRPLSHAAIVARELGIPAVVGCGNATSKLKTGDRVAVDGGQGIVQLEPRQTPVTSEEENGKLIE